MKRYNEMMITFPWIFYSFSGYSFPNLSQRGITWARDNQ